MKKTPIVNSLISLVFAVAVAATMLIVNFDGNITGFFCIGDSLPLSPYLEEESAWINEGTGYDGQMFLTLALDPVLRHEDTLKALDNPRYRYRRIGYPLLGYLIGLGHPAAIPYALVMINILGCAAAVFFGTKIVESSARIDLPRYFPLLILVAPGLWISLCLSTADIVASVLLLAGLSAMHSRRDPLAAITLCTACFVRETYIASLLVLAVYQYFKGRKRATLWFALAALPPILWTALVYLFLDGGTGGIRENLGFPFIGIIGSIKEAAGSATSPAGIFEMYCLCLLLLVGFIVTMDTLLSWRNPSPENIAVLPLLVLLMLSRPQILDYHGGYLRVFLPLFVVSGLALSADKMSIGRIVILLLSFVCSAAYIVNIVIS